MGFGKRRPALMNAMLEKERSAVQGVMRSLERCYFSREDGGDVYGGDGENGSMGSL
jgi:hypothetical protein